MLASSPWQSRIVGYGEEPPESLLAHPMNPKIHPKPQQDALTGSLTELGWIAPVIVNRLTAHVLDGHARIELAISRGEPSVPIAYVELPADLEPLALAIYDPIGALAATDAEKLDELLREVSTGDAAVQAMLDGLAGTPIQYGADEVGRTPEDKLDFYESGTIRQIVLLYGADEYAEVSEILGWLRGHLGAETNTDAITAVLRDYRAAH